MVSELRPRGIGEMLDTAVNLYRSRFRALVLAAAIVVVPVQILNTLVLLSAQPDSVSINALGQAQPQYAEARDAMVRLAASFVVVIISALATALVVAVCTRFAANAYIDGAEENRAALRSVGRRFFGIIGLDIVILFSVGFGLFVGVFAGALIVLGVTPILAILTGIVGALTPYLLFAVAPPVLILEGAGVFVALGRSVRLVSRRILGALGLVAAAQSLSFVVNIGLSVAATWFFRSGGSVTGAAIAQGFVSAVSSALTTPFVACAIVALYFDLRIRREGFDIQLLIQRGDARHTAAPPLVASRS